MEASFKTVVHQFAIREGALQQRPLGIVVAEGAAVPASRRHRGAMYLLIEVLGGLPDPAYTLGHLAQIMQDEYYQAAGSVTGGIGQALRAANDWLFEENLNSPREQRGVAGVSCVVLRDGDLYLGQIGPALAYLVQADGLRRFPEDSPWLSQAIPGEAERAAWPPLGVRRVVEPQFYHATPDTGQVLVMASPALDRVASPRAIAEAIADGGETAQRRLLALAAGQDVRALIVTLAAREPGAAGRDDERPAAARDERPAPQPMPATAARRSQGPGERPQPRRRSPSQVLGLLRRVLPERPGGAARPQRRPAAATSPAPQRQATRLVVALAILLPLLVLALVAGVRYQYEHNQRQRVAELVRQAGEARTAAANTPDAAAQRVSLRQAIGLLDQALAIAPGEPQVSTLREQVLAALDAASGVRRLYTLWELADLPAGADGQAQVARLLPRDLDLFILDRGADRAYGRQLNPAGDALAPVEGSAVLVQKGDSRAGTAVGELIDLLWMPAGGERREPGLVFLDRNGSLLEWRPAQGLAVLPVANSSTWRKPAAAGGYGGNLYLLDPQLNRILKYVPSATGYTAPPVDYIADPGSVDLSGAVDMAIDGYIYVLMADGTVLKYLSGRPVTFNISGLDEPLRNPVAIYASGDDEAHGFLYVADAGLARVVQLSKQGQFIRQFKAAEGQGQLADLSGLSVDEAKQRLYLGSGGKVYMAPLSAEAPTPVPTQTAS